MADPQARTLENWAGHAGYPMQGGRVSPDAEGLVDITGVSGGMVLNVPRENTPPNSFLNAKNARARGEWVGRREGTVLFGSPYPDALPVLKVLTYLDVSGNSALLRVTKDAIHVRRAGNVWQSYSGGSLGRDFRVSFSQMYGMVFLTNGGKIRMLNVEKGAVEVLDSPILHFITSFGDRIVGARRDSPTIWWSGNLNPRDWTGETAGEETLVQNTSDISDATTGVFGLGRELVILRRRSIWGADRQAIATAPFRFAPIADDVGCDMPYTAVRAQGGIVFASHRMRSVFFFHPSARPQSISGQVEREIFKDIKNLQWAEGAYDPFEGEYVLGIPTTEGAKGFTRQWRYSFKTGAWTYDELPFVTSLGEVSTPADLVMIDDLAGMIDTLAGTIDDLGGTPGPARSLVFMGGPTGQVIQFDGSSDTDWNGTFPEMELLSQDIGSPAKVRSFMDALFRVDASRAGSISLALLADEKVVSRLKTFDAATSFIRFPKPRIQGLDLRFRIRCAQGDFQLSTYSLRLMEKGLARP